MRLDLHSPYIVLESQETVHANNASSLEYLGRLICTRSVFKYDAIAMLLQTPFIEVRPLHLIMVRLFEFTHASTAGPSPALRLSGLLVEDIKCSTLEASAFVLSPIELVGVNQSLVSKNATLLVW